MSCDLGVTGYSPTLPVLHLRHLASRPCLSHRQNRAHLKFIVVLPKFDITGWLDLRYLRPQQGTKLTIQGGREISAILLTVVGDRWKDQKFVYNMGSKLDSFLRKRCFLRCFFHVVLLISLEIMRKKYIRMFILQGRNIILKLFYMFDVVYIKSNSISCEFLEHLNLITNLCQITVTPIKIMKFVFFLWLCKFGKNANSTLKT